MQTRMLLRLALITSIIGLLLLFFLAENLEPKLVPIGTIKENQMENYVKIKGNIESARETEGLDILTLKDSTGKITVIAYKKNKIIFPTGAKVEVIGKVTEYRGELQIEAIEIKEV